MKQSASLVPSRRRLLGGKFMAEVRHVIAWSTRGCRRSGFPKSTYLDSNCKTTESSLDRGV